MTPYQNKIKMKKDDIIKILSEFKCEHILDSGEHENIISEFDFDYIADRIIALGKPEPLTKNKQTVNICKCIRQGRHINLELKTNKCMKCGNLITNMKDATSR